MNAAAPNIAPPALPSAGASRSLRVLQVVGGHIRSGVESVVLQLMDGLRLAGHQPLLLTLHSAGFTDEARGLGYEVHTLAKRGQRDWGSIPRLARRLKELEVDLVHAHEVNGAFYACPAAWLARRPVVCTLHIDPKWMLQDLFRWRLPRGLAWRYYVRLVRGAAAVTTVSQSLRDLLLRQGLRPNRVTYIPNGIDAAAFPRADERRAPLRREWQADDGTCVILAVARLAPMKNLPLLLRAVARLKAEGLPVRLAIAGTGPQREPLGQLAGELGLGESLLWLGFRDDVPALLAACDVLALSSHNEGMPMVVLEAMAAGRPVVATAVDGVPDLITDGVTGRLVAPGDEAAFAAALADLARNPHERERLAIAGKDRATREFDVRATCQRMQAVYAEVLARCSPRLPSAASRGPA